MMQKKFLLRFFCKHTLSFLSNTFQIRLTENLLKGNRNSKTSCCESIFRHDNCFPVICWQNNLRNIFFDVGNWIYFSLKIFQISINIFYFMSYSGIGYQHELKLEFLCSKGDLKLCRLFVIFVFFFSCQPFKFQNCCFKNKWNKRLDDAVVNCLSNWKYNSRPSNPWFETQ